MTEQSQEIYDMINGDPEDPERGAALSRIGANEEMAKEYIHAKNTLALASLAPSPADGYSGRKSYGSFRRTMRRRKAGRVALRMTAVAASLALVLGAGWVYITHETYRSLENLVNVFEVPAGQRAILTLNDGTRVQLNARSVLEYPAVFSKDSRNVAIRGEGFFEVAKDNSRPFVVSTTDVDIKVLGTHFDVMAYEDRNHEVSVLEGSVEVSVKDGSEKMILLPGNTVRHADGRLRMTLFDNEDDFMWTRGVYAFVSTDFRSIIEKLSFYYDVNIELRNSKLGDIIYTGKFRQMDGALEILKVIQNIHGFTVRKSGDGTIVIE